MAIKVKTLLFVCDHDFFFFAFHMLWIVANISIENFQKNKMCLLKMNYLKKMVIIFVDNVKIIIPSHSQVFNYTEKLIVSNKKLVSKYNILYQIKMRV